MTKFTHSKKKSDSKEFAKFLYSSTSSPIKKRIARRKRIKETEKRIIREKEQAGYVYINRRVTRREAIAEVDRGVKFVPQTKQQNVVIHSNEMPKQTLRQQAEKQQGY